MLSRASLLPKPVTEASETRAVRVELTDRLGVISSALFTIGWLLVRFVRAVIILLRVGSELIGLVPVRVLVACDRIALRTSGCFVFKEVLPASILDSCNV